MKYLFKKTEINKIIAETKKGITKGIEPRPTYGQSLEKAPTPPGIHFAGDQGVYMMSNCHTEKKPTIAYVKGCNPDKDGDDWYDVKVSGFGGDDGVDHFDLSEIEQWVAGTKGVNCEMNCSPGKMQLIWYGTPAAELPEGSLNKEMSGKLITFMKDCMRSVEQEFGVTMTLGKGTFSGDALSFNKLTFTKNAADGSAVTPHATLFKKKASSVGLSPDDLGKIIETQGKRLKVIGWKARTTTKQILVEDVEVKDAVYRMDPGAVLHHLKMANTAKTKPAKGKRGIIRPK